jgi:N-methylhydantoinase A/oxoprolinase/acetone carboxylase beta subunit
VEREGRTHSIGIGIDAGGTYTDGVLIDNKTLEVVHWAKKTTTHHDLGIGVGRVLESLLAGGISPRDVHQLAVSTTLATNAIVGTFRQKAYMANYNQLAINYENNVDFHGVAPNEMEYKIAMEELDLTQRKLEASL